MNSDKSETKSGLVRRHLTVLDLKTSSWAFSASVQWTICRGLLVPQQMRNCHGSHEQASLQTWRRSNLASGLNTVRHNKKSASVQQADVLTNLTPTKNLQFYDKISASVWQPSPENRCLRSEGKWYSKQLGCKWQMVDQSFHCQVFLTFSQVLLSMQLDSAACRRSTIFFINTTMCVFHGHSKKHAMGHVSKCYTEQARTALQHQIGKILH